MRSFFALAAMSLLGLVIGGGVAHAGPAPLDDGPAGGGGGSTPVTGSSDGFFMGLNTWATVALTAVIGFAVIALVATLVTRYQHHHAPTHA